MLIRFFVENFLSLKDEVEFSMVAGRSRKHPNHVVRVRDLRLLKTGVIFGANASGKTNLIKAYELRPRIHYQRIIEGRVSCSNSIICLDNASAAETLEIPFRDPVRYWAKFRI